MPTYVYKFIETGETIEVQQSFTDDTLTEYVHPETGATLAVKKVFLPVGITFKGEGFYKTDSRGKAGSGTKRSGDDGGSGSESSSTTSEQSSEKSSSSSSSSSESSGSSGSSGSSTSSGSTSGARTGSSGGSSD